jgi:hypothetical protein
VAFRHLNQHYNETYCRHSEQPEYEMLLSQRPLPKIQDEKFKMVLRSPRLIETRVKLFDFYLDMENIEKQFEAIKAIRNVLNLTPEAE